MSPHGCQEELIESHCRQVQGLGEADRFSLHDRLDLPAIRAHLKPFFAGLRKGEVRHLEWSDVDLKHRLVHVRPKESWTPKTEGSARTVPLCDAALEALLVA